MANVHKSQRSDFRLTPSDRPWRIAFPFLHEKRIRRASGLALNKPRYDAVLLAPKLSSDPSLCSNYQFLAAHCMEAATKSWQGWPPGGHWPIQDGDAPIKPKAPVPGVADVAPKDYPWRKNNWVIEISSGLDTGPNVSILQNGQVIDLPAKAIGGRPYYKSGDYVVASINAYTFNTEGKFGCNFGFEGVLFVAEGELIGGGPRSGTQIFGGISSNAPGSLVPQPPPLGYAPPQPATAPANPLLTPSEGGPHRYIVPPNAPSIPPWEAPNSATPLGPSGYGTNSAPPSAPPAAPSLPPFPTR